MGHLARDLVLVEHLLGAGRLQALLTQFATAHGLRLELLLLLLLGFLGELVLEGVEVWGRYRVRVPDALSPWPCSVLSCATSLVSRISGPIPRTSKSALVLMTHSFVCQILQVCDLLVLSREVVVLKEFQVHRLALREALIRLLLRPSLVAQ